MAGGFLSEFWKEKSRDLTMVNHWFPKFLRVKSLLRPNFKEKPCSSWAFVWKTKRSNTSQKGPDIFLVRGCWISKIWRLLSSFHLSDSCNHLRSEHQSGIQTVDTVEPDFSGDHRRLLCCYVFSQPNAPAGSTENISSHPILWMGLYTNMTGWKINLVRSCISYWTWGYSNVMFSLQVSNQPIPLVKHLQRIFPCVCCVDSATIKSPCQKCYAWKITYHLKSDPFKRKTVFQSAFFQGIC